MIVLFIDNVHGRPAQGFVGCQNCLVDAEPVHPLTAKRWQEGRVNVQNTMTVRRDDGRWKLFHISREDDQVRRGCAKRCKEIGRKSFLRSGEFLADVAGRQSGSTREIEDAGVRIVAHNKDNTGIRQLAILNRIQYRFEVRSPSRPEHRNLEHAVIVAQF